MRRITLIRHGEAAAAWNADTDPGLSELGRAQAETVAADLSPRAPGPVVTSPLLRCRETAMPLASRWSVEPTIDERVAEIPSPGLSLDERGPWLRSIMSGTWSETSPELRSWRDRVVDAVRNFDDGTVVFSHYVALNALIGAIRSDDRVTCFHPDNCSVTVVDVAPDPAVVVTLGGEARTVVN